MTKVAKIKEIVFTLILWIVYTLIISNMIITALVPVAGEYFWRGMRGTAHLWYDESRYIAAWDRPLMSWEARALIEGAKYDEFGGDDKLYHLLHHGNEYLVRSELRKAADSSDKLRALVAEFALFKLRDNPSERLDKVLNYAITGGLSSDKAHYLVDLEWMHLESGTLKDEIQAGEKVQWRAIRLVSVFLDPVEDSDYLPQFIEAFSQDQDYFPYLIWIIAPFYDDPRASGVIDDFERRFQEVENPPWEGTSGQVYNGCKGWLEDRSILKYDMISYDGKVQLNLRWTYISYALIGVWLVFAVLYVRHRIRQLSSAP